MFKFPNSPNLILKLTPSTSFNISIKPIISLNIIKNTNFPHSQQIPISV